MKYYVKARKQHQNAVAIAPLIPTYRIRLCQTIINHGYALRSRGEFDGALKIFLEAREKDDPDEDVMYLTGRALLLLARRIEIYTENPKASNVLIADKAIASAKEIFRNLAPPKYGTRDRILSDRKLKNFVACETGTSFLDWFASEETNASTQIADENGGIERR